MKRKVEYRRTDKGLEQIVSIKSKGRFVRMSRNLIEPIVEHITFTGETYDEYREDIGKAINKLSEGGTNESR